MRAAQAPVLPCCSKAVLCSLMAPGLDPGGSCPNLKEPPGKCMGTLLGCSLASHHPISLEADANNDSLRVSGLLEEVLEASVREATQRPSDPATSHARAAHPGWCTGTSRGSKSYDSDPVVGVASRRLIISVACDGHENGLLPAGHGMI